ncbi:hypothetical protein BIWAKO_05286 [Bosea sp. BIWAKO-01]|nr:hypothetical protein BIWAKO_05286 [Bosea sp. BIWAKO-01]
MVWSQGVTASRSRPSGLRNGCFTGAVRRAGTEHRTGRGSMPR